MRLWQSSPCPQEARLTLLLPSTHSPCVWRALGWWLRWHSDNLSSTIQKVGTDLVLSNTCLKGTEKQSPWDGLHRRLVEESLALGEKTHFTELFHVFPWVSLAMSLLTCWAGLAVRAASGTSPGAKSSLWTWMLCTEVGTWQTEVPSRAQLRSTCSRTYDTKESIFFRKYYKTWQAMSFSINIFSLPPPILVQPDPGHGIHHVYSDAVVQIPVVVIGEKQHLQRNCASSAIHLTLRQTSKIRRMNCTPDVPLSFHWLQREDKNLAQI